eukprot:COSAG02_NODE_263_length_26627_cov_47.198168_11_plen_199_part_00
MAIRLLPLKSFHGDAYANRALLYTATMARDGGSNDAKRKRAAQSAVGRAVATHRWASGGDSPCAAQTRPSPTKPERPPSSGHTDASAESWCAALHQGVACAQGQDVVVAHHPGGGDYLRINSLRRVERKGRLRWSGAGCASAPCSMHPARRMRMAAAPCSASTTRQRANHPRLPSDRPAPPPTPPSPTPGGSGNTQPP